MIITRTPNRISFFGGGTDYPLYYREHGGAVISTTINHYNYLIVRQLPPFFDYKYRLRYRLNEYAKTVAEIQHPSIRECLKKFDDKTSLEIIHNSDLPSMSGIGSSSSFTVGLIHALHGLMGKSVSKERLARHAIDVEQNQIVESVGSQDQTTTAYGGLNFIEFADEPDFTVTPVMMKKDKMKFLHEHLMLFFTGFTRDASLVAQAQIASIPNKISELHALREITEEALQLMQSVVLDKQHEFARLLDSAWEVKQTLSNKISNEQINHYYTLAKKAGALGGKLLGAGNGGFFLFYVLPERQEEVKEALKTLLYTPFHFESYGSQIVYYRENEEIHGDIK